MKRMLLLLLSLLLISSVSMADHISVYSDATGTSCYLGNIAGQFSTTATVIHKFTLGATGSLFDISVPPGTAFFSFNTPYVPVPVVQPVGIALGYGQCLSGTIVLGTILAIYTPGTLQIVPADGYTNILYTDCSFAENAATGGRAFVNTTGDCVVAVEPSTWGSVKALYR